VTERLTPACTRRDGADRIGVVLGAGGVLGAAWTIGALRAFEEVTGRDPRTADALVGTSSGSVLAALLACGVSAATMVNHQRGVVSEGDPVIAYDHDAGAGGALPPRPRLRLGSAELLMNTARRPWRVPPLVALSAVLPQGRGSLDPVRRVIDAVAPEGVNAWAPHPRTYLVTTDYQTGRRVPFGRAGAPPARLSTAVAASCAIPGWYAPVRVGGRRYVDGGTCSPASVDLLAGAGLDEVFVISPLTSVDTGVPSSVPARLERGLRLLLTRRLAREVEKVRATGTRVTVLTPGPEDLRAMGVNVMDPSHRDEVLTTSLRTSERALRLATGPGFMPVAG
jgi:NTE family protein